jgi:hemerythrin-like metal-binding protein
MAFITWNDDFLTGIEIVDLQHRWLVDMINDAAPKFLDCAPKDKADRRRLFEGLIDYTSLHFRTEEDIMAETGVDARVLEHHQATHAALVREVLDWREKIDYCNPADGQNFLGFLAGWLLFHVLGEDQTMARQVRARKAGLSPAAAYEAGEGNCWSPKKATLAKTMARVFAQLSGQIRETSMLNEHLEQQVAARTAELRQMAEDLRVARDAAEGASEAKSRFLGMVSHELRTPMNAIVGFTGALRQSGLSKAGQGLASRIMEASSHLQDMINGLIEYTRDAGEIDSMPFKLATLLDEASRQPFAIARRKGLSTEIHLDPHLPSWCFGDSRRIALIVRQLAANAAKFTQTGGVRVGADQIERNASGVRMRLWVADTGIGIPIDKQKGLFDIFHQVDDSPTRTHGGVGLGLALTRQAARIIGADIDFRSDSGQGSVFWLDIRLKPTESPAMEQEGHAETPNAAAPAPVICRQTVRNALPSLLDLLRQDDTGALDYVAEHEAELTAVLGQDFQPIRHLIENFDMPEALRRLDALAPSPPPMRPS